MPEVIFNGPDGRLEGRYHHSNEPNAPVALVLHPHPQHGGTMNHKVVYSLYHSFVRQGFSCLRVNFRGVGRSQGKFDNGQGELADAAAALDWMQAYNPNARSCWVGGYSFGAWIGMQLLMRRPEIDGFVAAAPPANMYDFSFLAPCPASGFIIHGKSDDVVPEAAVLKLAQKLSVQRNICVKYQGLEGANHFFSGCIDEFTAAVDDYLTETVALGAAAAPQPVALAEA